MSVRKGLVVLAVASSICSAAMAQLPGEAWKRIGLLSGNITAATVSPGYNSDQTVFAGLSGSGLWKSTDRGQNWVHLSSIPDTKTVTAIAFDPRHVSGNGYPVYVGTKDGYVYASFDDFATVNPSYAHQFTNLTQGTPVAINSLAVPPAGSWQYFLFVATGGGGISYSYTYGYNYLAASASTPQNTAYVLATSPSGQLLAACLYSDGGPVFSYGGGTSWTYKGPPGMVAKTPTGLAIAATNTDVFLTVAGRGMWVSHDGGSTWTAGCDGSTADVGTSLPTAAATCPRYASDSEVLEGRFDGLFTSVDGGATCAASSPTGYVTAISFSPGYHTGGLCDAFVGTATALFRVSCATASAPPATVTPPAVTVSAIAVAKNGPPGAWGQASAGLIRNTAMDKATGLPFFLQYNASGSIFGNGSDVVAVRVAPTYRAGGACGTDDATILVAERSQGVYKSMDHGNSWAKLDVNSQGVSTWPPSPLTVNDLAISPKYATGSSDETLFAATSAGLYRWDGFSTGWVHVATDWNYNFTKVALPNTYDRAAGTAFPYQVVYVATDHATSPGLYFSINDGQTLGRFASANVQVGDITAIAFSPGYGASDLLAFVSRATSGVFFSADYPAGTGPVYWCPFNTNLLSLYVRDLAASPAFYSANYVRLLAATDSGPAYCNFLKTSGSYQCVGATYAWASSTIPPPSGCKDSLCASFAYLGTGEIAGLGTAEDGVFFSTDGGQSFPSSRAGIGYYSLPNDVWTTFPYMRPDIYDPSQASPVLLASSPTYGVFVSRDKGNSFQPFNGGGCTDLNNGAYGLSGGFERLGADPTHSGWFDDVLFAGTGCPASGTGLYYRRMLARDVNAIYYPYFLDWYPWQAASVTPATAIGPFQKIVSMTNGNIAEPIWASSQDGACPGAGEYKCPSSTPTAFTQYNSGLPSPNASSVRFGQNAAPPAPAPLSLYSPVNGSVTQGNWNYYAVVVPNGMTHMNVALFNMSNDADLYVRYAGLPSPGVSDYASTYGQYWPDVVNVDASGGTVPLTPGIWYIGVYGYGMGTDGYTIYVTDAVSLATGAGVTSTVNQYTTNHYCIVVPPTGYPHLNMTLTGLSGDADLYAKCQLIASNSSYDFGSWNGGTTNENIDITSATSPPLQLPCLEYVGVYGYAAGPITYTVTASLMTTLVAPAAATTEKGFKNKRPAGALSPSRFVQPFKLPADANPASDPTLKAGPAPTAENIFPGPLAPSAGSIWGTVTNTGSGGVFKGTDTSTFASQIVPSPDTVTWVARNGMGSTALDLTRNTQTVLQLTGGTLLCGQNGALWQSPAPDEGLTTWRDFTANFPVAAPNVKDFLECANGDVLVGVNGTAGTGGVWLSGCQGRYWMNLSSGFDASSQQLESVVKDNPLTGKVWYYAGTDATGAYTRTITPSAYPAVSSFTPDTGPASGGTAVTINGTGFSNNCPTGNAPDCPFSSPQVFFGDTMVPATFVSATQVTATTPVHGTGSVTVRVMNPDTRWGASASTFTFTGDTNLTINPVTRPSGHVNLYWGVNTEVTVQRATDPQFTQNVTSFAATGDNWTDDSGSGTDGTTYFYRLQ